MNSVPKIVQERLRATSDASHPDANLLGAFAEKALSSPENAKVLRHLARCADCRQVVLLAQPEIEAAIQVTRFPAASPTSWHGMRWAFWAAAVVTVAGMLAWNDRGQSSHSQMAQVAQPAVHAVSPARSIEAALPDKTAAAPTTPTAEFEAKKSVTDGPTADRPTEVARLDQLQASAPPPAPTMRSENSPMRDSIAGNTGGNPPGEMAAKDAAPSPFTPRAAFASDAKAEASRVAANEMVLSKSSGPRWTLTPDGVLQRSVDAGKTWETVTVASNANFRVVSALGSDIWVGGAAGALYHSADAGQHWQKMKPAVTGSVLDADITSLEFSDAQHGKVSTTDGIWITSDGGQTWQKQ